MVPAHLCDCATRNKRLQKMNEWTSCWKQRNGLPRGPWPTSYRGASLTKFRKNELPWFRSGEGADGAHFLLLSYLQSEFIDRLQTILHYLLEKFDNKKSAQDWIFNTPSPLSILGIFKIDFHFLLRRANTFCGYNYWPWWEKKSLFWSDLFSECFSFTLVRLESIRINRNLLLGLYHTAPGVVGRPEGAVQPTAVTQDRWLQYRY